MKNFTCRPPMPPCPEHPFPDACPPPAKPIPPCIPPAPSVVKGESLYEAVDNLTQRVNTCISTYNEVMANCYATLHNLQAAAQENGSYYSPCDVWTEDGYQADESATYTLVHKNVVDRRNEPIFMQLGLAYSNTTNSKIEQKIDSASKAVYADKIFIAQPMGENGWYGNVIWNGAPLPSDTTKTTLYTMGFTKAGVMRVYNNSVSIDQMLRDTIVNSMGVSGVLVQNGQVTEDSWINTIPQYDQQTSRVCIGQNLDTREVIILVCGAEDNVSKKGLTSKACANILVQYGCDIAVEICEGAGAGAMDKGYQMFIPADDTIPSGYAFWYISRARFYNNDYEREMAELVQNMGQNTWQGYLTKLEVDGIKTDLETEITNREEADKQLQANIDAEATARQQADQQLQDNIDAEEAAREAADTQLQNNIDAEEAARQAADETLQKNIDAEAAAREAAVSAEATARDNADKQLQANIDAEEEARQEADQELKTEYTDLIDQMNVRVTAAESAIKILQTSTNSLQEALTATNATVTSLQEGVNNISTALNNVQQQLEDIREGTTEIGYLSLNGGTMNGAINMGNNGISNLTDPVAAQDAATKAYVDAHSSSYTLPPATPSTLGGVKVGEGLTVTGDGTLSATGGGASGDYLPISGGTLSGDLGLDGHVLYLATGVPIKYNSVSQEIEIG